MGLSIHHRQASVPPEVLRRPTPAARLVGRCLSRHLNDIFPGFPSAKSSSHGNLETRGIESFLKKFFNYFFLDIDTLTGGRLKMTGGIVALGDEDVIVHTALEWLVERNGRAHESLIDVSEALEAWLKFQMLIDLRFGDGGDDGDIITLGADVMRGGDDGNIDIYMIFVSPPPPLPLVE